MAMQLVSEEHLREIAEPFEGVAALHDRFAEHGRAAARLIEDWDELLEQCPARWVAVGPDGVLAVSDRTPALLSDVRGRGFESDRLVVESAETNSLSITVSLRQACLMLGNLPEPTVGGTVHSVAVRRRV